MVAMTRYSLGIAVVATILPSAWCATVDLPIHFRNSYVGGYPNSRILSVS